MQHNFPKTKAPVWLLAVVLIASLLMANCFSSDEEPTPEVPTPTQVVATSTPPPPPTTAPATAAVAVAAEATAAPAAEANSAQAAASEPYPAPDTAAADTQTKSADSESKSTASVAAAAYPPPAEVKESSAQTTTAQTAASAAPAAQNGTQPYPAPSGIRGPDFTVDPATKGGDTVVRGTGPAGVSIRIVNASYSGDVLGKGQIGEDGKFEIEVTALPGGDRLGIMLEDLSESEYKITDFVNNENYRDLPMVGLLVAFFDIPR